MLMMVMLTGLLIFIYAGSLTQIIVGQFIAVISMRILSMANPYVEDIDDSLANMGQLQIVLVFIASLVLFAKDMPEQEGAPGNIFKGPLFAFVMVLIGTMTLLMTFYMLVAEYCGIESPKDAQEAASSVASSLRRFSRGRNLFSETKVPKAVATTQDIDSIIADFDRDMGKTMAPSGSPRQWWKKDAEGADAAPEEIVVTPHGHEE